MENFDKVVKDIMLQLSNINYAGDMSDIGNEVGIAIGAQFDEDNTLKDFISGLKHGVSLADGTH